MGRKRRRINEQLPPYVYRRKHGFIYRPYLGREEGRSVFGQDVYLVGPTASTGQIWKAYEASTGKVTGTLQWLLDQYHKSERFRELGSRTRTDYAGYRKALTQRVLRGGGKFGQVALTDIDMFAIRQYLDTYEHNGIRAPIAANRHIQYLKAAWNWGRQRHPEVPPNPCAGVQLNKQTPRSRLIGPAEYAAALDLATGYLPIMMEIAYLCRARRGEVTALKVSDSTEDGLRLERSKGSEGEVTTWTPRLRKAVAAAKAFNADAPTPISGAYLIHDKHGAPIKKNAFDSAWRRLMEKVVAAGGERFTFHDIKAMGITAHKTHHGGHRSPAMRKVYVRDLPKIEATE